MSLHRRTRPLGRKSKGRSQDDFAKNLAELFPCPEDLSEAESKGDRRICLMEGISRQDSLQAVMWLPSTVFFPFTVKGGEGVKHTAEGSCSVAEPSISTSEVLDSIPGIRKGIEK